MLACYFYKDSKGRTYYIPECTIQDYKKNSTSHVLPQGVKKFYTKDHYVVYFQHPFQYPFYVQKLQQVLFNFTFSDFQKEIANSHKTLNRATFRLPIDVYRHIGTFLDKSGRACLSLTCSFFKMIIEKPDLKNLSVNALKERHLKVFLWSRKFNPLQHTEKACYIAAKTNNLPLLIKLHELGYPLRHKILYKALPHFPIVKWVQGKCSIVDYSCVFEHATATGNEKMFEWAKITFGNIKGHYLAQNAAHSGSIVMLQALTAADKLSDSCPYRGAVNGDQLHVLEWLKLIGLPPPIYFESDPCLNNKPHLRDWIADNWNRVPVQRQLTP